jgi:hypothetical protein
VAAIVGTSRFGNRYLADPDGGAPNNLFSLPECS